MYIYAEEVFITNFTANFLISFTLCSLRAYDKKPLRSALSALLGTAYSFAALFAGSFLFSVTGKIFITAIMAFVIGYRPTVKRISGDFALLLLLACLCAGFTLLLSLFDGGAYLSFSFARISFLQMLIGVMCGCMCGRRLIKFILFRMAFDKIMYDCELSYKGRTVGARLLADSGNLLTTLSGEYVCVVKSEIFARITGVNARLFSCYEDYVSFLNDLEPEETMRISAVNANTATGNALMTVFRIDSIMIDKKYSAAAFIGICDIADNEIDGLFNPLLLNGGK